MLSLLHATHEGIPERRRKFQLSPAIDFNGFTVVANDSFDSNLPGSLPFNEGDHLIITDATGIDEWRAYSGSSTSGYGVVPKGSVKFIDLTLEPWFFGQIPTGIATAILREQMAGCFILRRTEESIVLSFRADLTVKHVEVAFDDSSHTYRIKDGTDSVSYVNFLQFPTIQQLVDQYKHNPTLGVTLDKYPTLQNVEEIWRIESNEVSQGDEIVSTLPWTIAHGKFRDQCTLVHALRDNSTNTIKENFINHERILMTLSHENVVCLYGLCTKGSRLLAIQSYMPKGVLSGYLARNASLLLLHPSDLVNIANQILLGMVYLEESGIVHGELVAENCLVGDNGTIKISGFHCARSSWCLSPLHDEDYPTKVTIPAPELVYQQQTSKSDAWAYGLLVYTIITAGQKPITCLEEVLRLESVEDILDQLDGFTDVMTLCLRMDPGKRPSFAQLNQRSGVRGRLQSTPSASSYSLEGSLSQSNGLVINNDDLPLCETQDIHENENHYNNPSEEFEMEEFLSKDWKESLAKNNNSTTKNGGQNSDIVESLRMAELAALKARVLQKRAEAEKERILNQVQEAEAKCLKEVEYITRTLVSRLNEAQDRATQAEQARYIADEVKRLTEEKHTLFKYESERKLHEMKSLLDETVLERDEYMSSLKALNGIGVDSEDSGKSPPKRTDSLQHLDDKYQRYISTSDRTIHNLKSQLNEVKTQRDSLIHERDLAIMDAKEARDLLDEVIKEKDDMAFRLEEASCEVERLEETISMMMHKRQKAERERDQLQILTDLSLMKLRQAEKPKKRHSVTTLSAAKEDRDRDLDRARRERRDPNLRRLSMQLMSLMTPSKQRRSSADTIYETSEVSSSDEAAFSSLAGSEDEMGSYSVLNRGRRQGRAEQSPLAQLDEVELTERRASTPRDSDSDLDQLPSLTGLINGGFLNTSDSEEHKEKSDIEQEPENSELNTNGGLMNGSYDHGHFEGVVSETDSVDCSNNAIPCEDQQDSSIESHRPLGISQSLPFPIPTLRIEEVSDTDDDIQVEDGVPKIAVSLVDDNDNLTDVSYFTDEDGAEERVFMVDGEDGATRMVYSFDDDVGSMKRVPQTTL